VTADRYDPTAKEGAAIAETDADAEEQRRFDALGEAFEEAVHAWIGALIAAAAQDADPAPVLRGLHPDGPAQAVHDMYGLPGLLMAMGMTPERRWCIDSELTLDWTEHEARALAASAAAGTGTPRRRAAIYYTLRRRQWLIRDIWPTDQPGYSLPVSSLPPAVRKAFCGQPPIPPSGSGLRDEVEHLLAAPLQIFGLHQAAQGLRLWRDYRGKVGNPEGRPPAQAAAVMWALVRITGRDIRQADVAGLFGISSSTVFNRFAQLRDALRLKMWDRRYCDGRPGESIERATEAVGLGRIPDMPL